MDRPTITRRRRYRGRWPAGLVLFAFGYLKLGRSRVLNWGATPDQVRSPIPGDELLQDAGMPATRAITIDAPPATIWASLVQMGVGRGGTHTYDWIERLFGLDVHNVDHIVPELQNLAVGDVMPMRPNDPGMRIEVLEPERAMSARSQDGAWEGSFALAPHNGSTRLIGRNRARVGGAGECVGMAAMEVGSLVMEREILQTIKQLDETLEGAR